MNVFVLLIKLAITPFSKLLHLVESFLFLLVGWYDAYLYSPLQTFLWPWVERLPRSVKFGGQKVDIFTANIVSWARTLLVIPIAITLKYDYHCTGFWCVIFHDFLDHLDGIVAKVHRQKYGQVDDPIVGGFMDAFCDKIVNVLSLWSILMVTDFSNMSATQASLYFLSCAVVISYEFTLGVVRVQDFFRAYYFREFKKVDRGSGKSSTAAVMEGKLKEKLESMGIAALCLAQSNAVPTSSVSGTIGMTCLMLSIRLAHSSLSSKLQARAPQIRNQQHMFEDDDKQKSNDSMSHDSTLQEKKICVNTMSQTESSVDGWCGDHNEEALQKTNLTMFEAWKRAMSQQTEENNLNDNLQAKRRKSLDSIPVDDNILPWSSSYFDQRVERVYTVGCFDLFHHGHKTLLEKMRSLGKKVVVGVHDSRSIYQLKKRIPIDSTVARMLNVRDYADEVFCVAGTDPTPYINCIFDKSCPPHSAMYVRGNDMPHFPARKLCERIMKVTFLPYTEGVSSTKLRKDLLNSSNAYRYSLDEMHNDLHMFY